MTAFGQDVGAGESSPYVAGDHLELRVTVLGPTGSPVDISEADAIRWGLFKAGPGGNPVQPAVLTKALGSGIAITDGAGGIFTVTIANGETGSLTGALMHEAEITDADGRVATVLRGQFSITAQALLPVVP